MNQPIELQSLRDLSQYQVYEPFERRKFYLYVFKKSGYVNAMEVDTGRHIMVHVYAGTIHIGKPIKTKIKNRDNVFYDTPASNEKLGWIFDQETGWRFNPHAKQDIGDSVIIEYYVYYELIPGATRFEDKRPPEISVSPILFEEVSVFDIGDIGYELAQITPEQAAEKYFGVSDFRQFFSNYAAASKQMSLKNHPHVRRAPQISLTGMHPVEEVKPPSSFHEYLEAGKQLFSRKHPTRPDASLSRNASALAGAAGGLMLASGRPLSAISAMATMSFPFLRLMHEQKQLNQLERQRSSNERKKLLLLSDEEREKLLAKGALASELTRRLTTPSSQSVMNRSHFRDTYNRVHQKPTSARIHWSQKRRGGRKIRRTRKK